MCKGGYSADGYIIFVDGDDKLKAESISTRVKAIKESHADMCIFNHTKFFENGQMHDNLFGKPGIYNREDILKRIREMESGRTNEMDFVWDKIFCKKIIDRAGIRFCENMEEFEDATFLLDYIKNCCSIGIYPQVVYDYYVVKRIGRIKIEDCELYFDYLKEYMEKLHIFDGDTRNGFYHLYLNRMIGNIYRIVKKALYDGEEKEAFKQIEKILNMKKVEDALICYRVKNKAEDEGILEVLKHKDAIETFFYAKERVCNKL